MNAKNGTIILLAGATLIASTPSLAFAEELTDAQVELNNQVNEILRREDPDLALARDLTVEALREGPRMDLLLLALARIEQLDDNCDIAAQLLNETEAAPNDPSIPRQAIAKRIEVYRGQMKELCSGVIELECADPDTSVRIGQNSYTCQERIKLAPGLISLNVSLGEQSRIMEVDLEGAATKRVTISMTRSSGASTTSNTTPRTRRRILVGAGAASFLAGTTLTATSVARARSIQEQVDLYQITYEEGQAQEGSVNTMRAVGIPLALVGIAAATYGILAVEEQGDAATRGTPDGARWKVGVTLGGLTLHGSF